MGLYGPMVWAFLGSEHLMRHRPTLRVPIFSGLVFRSWLVLRSSLRWCRFWAAPNYGVELLLVKAIPASVRVLACDGDQGAQ